MYEYDFNIVSCFSDTKSWIVAAEKAAVMYSHTTKEVRDWLNEFEVRRSLTAAAAAAAALSSVLYFFVIFISAQRRHGGSQLNHAAAICQYMYI